MLWCIICPRIWPCHLAGLKALILPSRIMPEFIVADTIPTWSIPALPISCCSASGKVDFDMANRNLTRRQRKFIDFYVMGMSGQQAALKAGYSDKNAPTVACQNLQKPDIVAEIDRRRQILMHKSVIKPEALLKSYSDAILFNPKDLCGEDGKLLELHELPDEVAYHLQRYIVKERITEKKDGKKVIDRNIRYVWADKTKNRDSLAKLFGLMNGHSDIIDKFLETINNVAQQRQAVQVNVAMDLGGLIDAIDRATQV